MYAWRRRLFDSLVDQAYVALGICFTCEVTQSRIKDSINGVQRIITRVT